MLSNLDVIGLLEHLGDLLSQLWKLLPSDIATVVEAEPTDALDFNEPWDTLHTEENAMTRAFHKYRGGS